MTTGEEANPWDALASSFAPSNDEDIPPDAADNIILAWPVMLRCIQKYATPSAHRDKRALDYGCGGGRFTAMLASLGYETYGVDTSQSMVHNAKQQFGKQAYFCHGDTQTASSFAPFVLITSSMAFQFIEDIDTTLAKLAEALTPGGLLVFAISNPAYLRDWARAGKVYSGFGAETPDVGKMHLGGTAIPLYARSAKQYREILRGLGFKQIMERRPPFTAAFLTKYPFDGPTGKSEYLILGFQKVQDGKH
jgi:2-polyprenyl-3-methyl-5-hydroxy-6-metoxy-1,4-benzoquinol methylase